MKAIFYIAALTQKPEVVDKCFSFLFSPSYSNQYILVKNISDTKKTLKVYKEICLMILFVVIVCDFIVRQNFYGYYIEICIYIVSYGGQHPQKHLNT